MSHPVDARDRPLVLVIDDEQDIVDLVQYNLNQENYDTIVAFNGKEGLEMARKSLPDLIVIDIMMPVMDGYQATQEIRKDPRLSKTPVLILTAKDGEDAHVTGLESGSDIFLSKPISIPVFMSQVKALLRGSRFSTPSDILVLGDLVINRDNYEVSLKNVGESIHLARKEFDLLYFLASKPGHVYSRQELLDRVWGHDVYVVDRTIDVHIRKIREKIGDHFVETVKGVGYRLTTSFSR